MATSIASTLVSFWFAAKAYRRYVAILDEKFVADRDGELWAQDKERNVWSIAVGWSNGISLVFFIAGIGFLAYYCVSNV